MQANAGEESLRAGTVAAFRAGDGNGHHLLNRSQQNAVFLVMSNRHPEDGASYPDEDLAVRKGPDGKYVFSRKVGAPRESP